MNYRIEGLDAATGQSRLIVITADSEIEAAAQAKLQGVFPSAIREVAAASTSELPPANQSISKLLENVGSKLGCFAIAVVAGLMGLLLMQLESMTQPRSVPSRRTNPYSKHYTDPNYNPNKIITNHEEFNNAVVQEAVKANQEDREDRRIRSGR